MIERRAILANIAYAVQNDLMLDFRPEHGPPHFYSVAKSAVRIARLEEAPVDMDVVVIGSCVHDFQHRGGMSERGLRNFLERVGLEESQLEKVMLAVKHHSLNETPVTLEGEVIWVGDKLDYTGLLRYREAFFRVNRLTGEVKEREVKSLYDEFAERVMQAFVDLPHHPLMQKYPSALTMFNKQLSQTLDFMRGEGNSVFGGWVDFYDQALQNFRMKQVARVS